MERWGDEEGLQSELQKRQKQKFERTLEKTKEVFTAARLGSSGDTSESCTKKSKKSKFLSGALSAIRGNKS